MMHMEVTDKFCVPVKLFCDQCYNNNNNNNNIYLTAIEFSPGGSGFDTYTRNLNLSV